MRAALLGFVSLAVAAGLPLAASAQTAGGKAEDALRAAELSFGVYALGAKGLDVVLNVQRENGTLLVETAMRTSGALLPRPGASPTSPSISSPVRKPYR